MMRTRRKKINNNWNYVDMANNWYVNDICLSISWCLYIYTHTRSDRKAAKALANLRYHYYRLLGFLRRNKDYCLDYHQRIQFLEAKRIVRSSYHEET